MVFLNAGRLVIQHHRGFTLIEILIVIAILGILATSLFGNYMSSAKKGRDAQRKHDLEQLQRALEMYYGDNGTYPAATSGQISGCPPGTACVWGSGEFKSSNAANAAIYMKVVPKDPGSTSYCYWSSATPATSYQLYAVLENKQDPKKLTIAKSCGGSADIYDFGVSSANSTP